MNNIGESNPYLNFVFYAKYLCTKKLNHIFLGHFVAFSGTFFHFFLGQNFCFLGCNFTKIFSGKKLLSRALFGLFLDFFSGIFDFLAQNFQFFLGQCWLFLAKKKKHCFFIPMLLLPKTSSLTYPKTKKFKGPKTDHFPKNYFRDHF